MNRIKKNLKLLKIEHFYFLKPFVPRDLQLYVRRQMVKYRLPRYADVWPIDPRTAKAPDNWPGWPEGKKFAFILTHDVESEGGLKNCHNIAALEESLGLRSSFNFVGKDYHTPKDLRASLKNRGFEIGLHGLYHQKQPFRSKAVFEQQKPEIIRIIKDWDIAGFRSPSMFHNLDFIHELGVEYDSSTFDTDPFEPQPDGLGTIFPQWISQNEGTDGYVELPYTLPQDFLLFILMKEKNIDIWKKKVDWIAENGGMVLIDTHPDYMNFSDNDNSEEQYPAGYYKEFLKYVKTKYEGQYWHALAQDVASYYNGKQKIQTVLSVNPKTLPSTASCAPRPINACMLVYSFYESDNRVMRYAEALAMRGDSVDVIALGREGAPAYEEIRGVKVYRIQKRMIDEKGKISYLLKLLAFLFNSLIFLTKKHLKTPYDLIHVHSVPDFEVFATFFPKLQRAKVILDIHDIVPEFYASKFHEDKESLLFKALVMIEQMSSKYADHVIISNHLWEKTLLSRSVDRKRCTVIMNYPDETLFYPRPRERKDDKFVIIYPGTLGWHQGLDIAVKAFALIQDKVPNTEFHIYGRGTEKTNLENLIDKLGLSKRVFFKEPVSIEKIAQVMADADLGVIPKRNDPFGGEAFSTKTLEFMSLGVPIIVSKTKIDQFYFNDSVVKFFTPDDVEDLARCMLSLINDKHLRERLRENAKKYVEDYRWDDRKQEYFNLVDSLMREKKNS